MSEQQAQKRGNRSDAQKITASNDYEPIPAANPVAGAFGKHQQQNQTDQDLVYSIDEKRGKTSNPIPANGPGE